MLDSLDVTTVESVVYVLSDRLDVSDDDRSVVSDEDTGNCPEI